jgi:hypothetical protein
MDFGPRTIPPTGIIRTKSKALSIVRSGSVTPQEVSEHIGELSFKVLPRSSHSPLGRLLLLPWPSGIPFCQAAVEDMTKYDLYEVDSGENHRHAQESYPTPEAGNEYVLKLVMSMLAHRYCSHGDQATAVLLIVPIQGWLRILSSLSTTVSPPKGKASLLSGFARGTYSNPGIDLYQTRDFVKVVCDAWSPVANAWLGRAW